MEWRTMVRIWWLVQTKVCKLKVRDWNRFKLNKQQAQPSYTRPRPFFVYNLCYCFDKTIPVLIRNNQRNPAPYHLYTYLGIRLQRLQNLCGRCNSKKSLKLMKRALVVKCKTKCLHQDKILKSLDWQHLTLLFPELHQKIKPKGTAQSFCIRVDWFNDRLNID